MVFVTFIHPDLGIGGAERLIVDAAVALQNRGHKVQIVTAHHDKQHCFKETSDGTLAVISVGDWLPRTILGRMYALCAYLRMLYAALYCVVVSRSEPDIFVCDQISACVPILRFFSNKRVIFYCHFPDLLLTERKSTLKRLYRAPLDWLEETTTGMADLIMVNSKFTGGIFHQTFKTLSKISPTVVHPSLHFKTFDKDVDSSCLKDVIPPSAKWIFLSINRFERKKNLSLALKALSSLHGSILDDQWQQTYLIVAGGYDERVCENKEHYMELRQYCDKHRLSDHVTFMRSFSDAQKLALLKQATCLLYTPSNEHFGIVPIEAMYMGCPVIACNSGGPLETVRDGRTGYLCDPAQQSFAIAMKRFIIDDNLTTEMGKAGRRHVIDNFSFEAFTDRLEAAVKSLCVPDNKTLVPPSKRPIVMVMLVVAAIVVGCLAVVLSM